MLPPCATFSSQPHTPARASWPAPHSPRFPHLPTCLCCSRHQADLVAMRNSLGGQVDYFEKDFVAYATPHMRHPTFSQEEQSSDTLPGDAEDISIHYTLAASDNSAGAAIHLNTVPGDSTNSSSTANYAVSANRSQPASGNNDTGSTGGIGDTAAEGEDPIYTIMPVDDNPVEAAEDFATIQVQSDCLSACASSWLCLHDQHFFSPVPGTQVSVRSWGLDRLDQVWCGGCRGVELRVCGDR